MLGKQMGMQISSEPINNYKKYTKDRDTSKIKIPK